MEVCYESLLRADLDDSCWDFLYEKYGENIKVEAYAKITIEDKDDEED